MSDINFVLPIAGYTGFSIDSVVKCLLSGSTTEDICLALQALSKVSEDGQEGFLYDYLKGQFLRYPELVESVNGLRADEGLPPV